MRRGTSGGFVKGELAGVVKGPRGRANGFRACHDVPRRLWRLISLAHRRLLMLDYDGTLAPFKAAREAAYPLPRTLEMLRVVAGSPDTSVAIVSGRPVAEVDRLLGPIPALLVGEHGWETRPGNGAVVCWSPPRAALEALDQARRAAAQRGWGDRLEGKRSSVVLHTRGLPEVDARRIEDACAALWWPYCDRAPVNLDRINGGVELRTRGRDKGTAVLSLLSHEPPGTLAVYVGDDVSDEDAFRTVREFGFGVRVGSDQRPSLAAGRLPSCDAVADFLEVWQSVADPPRGRGGPAGGKELA